MAGRVAAVVAVAAVVVVANQEQAECHNRCSLCRTHRMRRRRWVRRPRKLHLVLDGGELLHKRHCREKLV